MRNLFSVQYRPICVTVKPVIVPQPTPFRKQLQPEKADWWGYSTQVNQNIDEVYATPECYKKFVRSIRMATRKHIPRGCTTKYIPGPTDESKTLYEAYQEQYRCNPLGDGTIDAGNRLIELMAEQKKERLHCIANCFTNNSQTLSSTQHTKQTDTLTEQHTTYDITLTTSQVQEAIKQSKNNNSQVLTIKYQAPKTHRPSWTRIPSRVCLKLLLTKT